LRLLIKIKSGPFNGKKSGRGDLENLRNPAHLHFLAIFHATYGSPLQITASRHRQVNLAIFRAQKVDMHPQHGKPFFSLTDEANDPSLISEDGHSVPEAGAIEF
jgi:hypothetical protein